ncbi:MAG: DNA-binding PadR family transcriptional regulator [Pseudohongiellaceae bacterium]|jgi:DNA-binding PadR family transcriptional regulator
MSLQTVILGLLRSTASGYELGSRLRSKTQHFWSASLSQIYPLLARMERDGLLHSGLASSLRGPPQKLHGLTDAGREALERTLEAAPEIGVERLPWLAEVSLAGAHPQASGAQRQLTRLHQHFSEQLLRLQAELAELSDDSHNQANQANQASDASDASGEAHGGAFSSEEISPPATSSGESTHPDPLTPDGYFERAARQCALVTAEARLAWCEETLMGLDSVPWTNDGPSDKTQQPT